MYFVSNFSKRKRIITGVLGWRPDSGSLHFKSPIRDMSGGDVRKQVIVQCDHTRKQKD